MVAYLPGCSLSFMAMMVSDTPLNGAEHMLVRDLHTKGNVKMWNTCIEATDLFDAELE
jgi:uncharacterized protein YcsI (UPF0317 family)